MKPVLLLLIFLIHGITTGQNTTIPDANFEQRLIDMAYDVPPIDGMVPTANINTITQLIVPNSSISDLTGIEDFLALEVLDISGNGISSLDLSNNFLLKELYTETNPIPQLDLSGNVDLEIIRVGYMQLSELDLSSNIALTQLSCQNNQIDDLDLSNNVALTFVICAGNLLCDLNLSSNNSLTTLICASNQLTRLDVKNGNNGILNVLSAFGNNASMCIQVDDEVAANGGTGVYGSWVVDPTISYSETCLNGPEIAFSGNGMTIMQGDNTPDTSDDTDFGSIAFGQFVDHVFTIQNNGDSDLSLTGVPTIEITGSVDFTVTVPPATLISSSGGTTTFTLRYEPSMAGTINTATISLENDDCNLSPFNFDVRGQSSTLSLEDENLSRLISLYPNPSRGRMWLDVGGIEIEDIGLYALSGRKILNWSKPAWSGRTELDLGHLNGMFLLKIATRNSQVIKKLVIY